MEVDPRWAYLLLGGLTFTIKRQLAAWRKKWRRRRYAASIYPSAALHMLGAPCSKPEFTSTNLVDAEPDFTYVHYFDAERHFIYTYRFDAEADFTYANVFDAEPDFTYAEPPKSPESPPPPKSP